MNKNLQQIFANNILLIRKEMGLSQEDFATKIGIHRTYMGKIERGESNITFNTLQNIATSLNIEPYKLLKENECQ
ncbi:MAG TPA: transcriptional regulator [Sulfurimonas sp. UBA12504]|nr:MAG: transcriptional regulator [Sulfurimonas sp. GWF2_37_8]DAB30927.1 MAG TPA: transcriptional regulator [Sulfurimonas sp. UBA12504]